MSSSVPTSPQRRVYPVYLRPEQNIPEVFNGSKFAPICGTGGGASDDDSDDNGRASYNVNSAGGRGSAGGISRDDIVVTVRSAQV